MASNANPRGAGAWAPGETPGDPAKAPEEPPQSCAGLPTPNAASLAAVEERLTCARPRCGHAAGLHGPFDQENGVPLGPCKNGLMRETERCACAGFVPPTPLRAITTFEEALAAYSEEVSFDEPWKVKMQFLCAALNYLGPETLPCNCVFFLAFPGGAGTGKTTALRALAALGDGEYIPTATPAALRATAEANRFLVIDEFDQWNKEPRAEAEQMLRAATNWDATHRLMDERAKGEKSGRAWVMRKIPIGGPKAFAYRGSLEEALGERAIQIEMPVSDKTPEEEAELLAANIDGPNPIGTVVADFWRGYCRAKAQKWTRAACKAWARSPEFKARVAAFPTTSMRARGLAQNILLVGDVLEIPVDEVIMSALAAAKDEEGAEIAIFKELLRAEYERLEGLHPGEASKEGIERAAIVAALNEARTAARQQPYKEGEIRKWLRDAGFRTNKSVVKRRPSGRYFLIFDGVVRRRLGIDPPPASRVKKSAASKPALTTAEAASKLDAELAAEAERAKTALEAPASPLTPGGGGAETASEEAAPLAPLITAGDLEGPAAAGPAALEEVPLDAALNFIRELLGGKKGKPPMGYGLEAWNVEAALQEVFLRQLAPMAARSKLLHILQAGG